VHGLNIPSWTWHDVGSSHTLGIRAVPSYITSDEQFLFNRGCYFPLHGKLPGDFRFANNNTTYEHYLLNFMFTLVGPLFPDRSLNSFVKKMNKIKFMRIIYAMPKARKHWFNSKTFDLWHIPCLSTECIVPHFFIFFHFCSIPLFVW